MHGAVAGTHQLCGARVLVLTPRGQGGAAAVVARVVPALSRGGRVQVLPFGRRPSDVRALREALHQCDVVHLHPSFRGRSLVAAAAARSLARRAGVCAVVQLHGVSRVLVSRVDGSRALRSLLLRTVLSAEQVLAVDPELAVRFVAWGVAADRVAVVDNPFDPAEVPTARAPGPPAVVFLGRLEPGKGARVFAAAAERARADGIDWVVAGAGSLEGALRGRGVALTGWLDTAGKRALWSRAAVLVLPSAEEAAPLVVLDALAAGVPVVATAVGAVPALVGASGVLLKSRDPDDIVGAVREVLRGPPLPRADVARWHPDVVAASWRAAYARGCA